MPIRRPLTIVLVLAACWTAPAVVRADVVVLANRAGVEVGVAVSEPDRPGRQGKLAPGDVLSVTVGGNATVRFAAGASRGEHELAPNAVYYFTRQGDSVILSRLVFDVDVAEEEPTGEEAAEPEPDVSPPPDDGQLGTIPVMVLVDDEEPAVRRVWEERLRKRVAAASAIFERVCRIRFEVVAAGTWDSDDAERDFDKSLREFETEVTPAPARVAVGFTSQYEVRRLRYHLGGTRGPLHSHVLIREHSQEVTDAERLEILVHELGHFLGAVHSAEPGSVMRPLLGRAEARAVEHPIQFDPVNTLAMALVAEEVRTRGAQRLDQLRPGTKRVLRRAYTAMARTLPKDTSAPSYVELLDGWPAIAAKAKLPKEASSLAAAAGTVVEAIARAAEENHRHSQGRVAGQLAGDRLSEHLVRRGAAAAAGLPDDVAARAFLVGLGVGLDDSTALRSVPLLGRFCREVEPDDRFRRRVAVLGSPTMGGRRDLAQHFAISAALAALSGPEAAETVGILKEFRDAQDGSGFSFVDLTADMAGVTLATRLLDGEVSLEVIAREFEVDHFLPGREGLREGLTWDRFVADYGSAEDDRFHRQQEAIRQRILALPGYRGEPGSPKRGP